MKPPLTFAAPSTVKSPGFNDGDTKQEQKRRGTGTLNQRRTLPHPRHLSTRTVRQTGAISVDSFAEESLDFVYLDANHKCERALEMMMEWYPKIMPGGVLAGHDYLDGHTPHGVFGVKTAVSLFEQKTGLRAAVTAEQDWASWYMFKPG